MPGMTYIIQGRLDGAICDYSEKDKMQFLNKVSKLGIVNMEMEALVFATLTHKAGIRSAVLCVTLLDRLHGDQVTMKTQVTIKILHREGFNHE
jgi:uridine phosphorylase